MKVVITKTHEAAPSHPSPEREAEGYGSTVSCLDCDYHEAMLTREGAEDLAAEHMKNTQTSDQHWSYA